MSKNHALQKFFETLSRLGIVSKIDSYTAFISSVGSDELTIVQVHYE